MANISVQDTDNEEVTHEQEAVPQEAVVAQEPEIYSKPLRKGPGKLVVLLTVLIVGVLAGGLIIVMNDRSHLKNEVNKLSQPQQVDPNAEAKQQVDPNAEAKQLSTDVGKLIDIQTDETPTIATVIDATKVKGQAFFANAQNGDKVLLYSKVGKAVLYRPSTNKIIEIAPINIGSNQTSPAKTK